VWRLRAKQRHTGGGAMANTSTSAAGGVRRAAMRVAMFSAKPHDEASFGEHNPRFGHEIAYLESRLDLGSARLAQGFPAVCAFVNDRLDAPVLAALAAGGTRLIALRCTGYNHLDLAACRALGLDAVRVSAYSPHSVAEFALALLLSLNRRIHRAYSRTRDNNFSLHGLLGFDLHGRTIGIVGTGRIGGVFARICRAGLGCEALAHDPEPDPALLAIGVRYAGVEALFAGADAISLHCPLTPATRHLVNAQRLALTRRGVLLVNTSRGGLVDSEALIEALKSGQVGAAALDVYEQEAAFFYENLSDEVIADDTLQRLLMFPNVLVTSHQGFFTREALADIATSVLTSLADFEAGRKLPEAIAWTG
jgi:D-lactate dehydrogenase